MNYLYYNMTCKVIIGNLVTEGVNSVKIEQSIKKQSDTAVITLPREFQSIMIDNKQGSIARKNITDFIKVGNPVSINLGYDGDNVQEFAGYVTSIGADVPLIIECEDEMYHLRRSNFVKVFPSVYLLDLLKYIAPNYKYNVIDNINLGKFTIANVSAFKVLESLRTNYGLFSYFVGKTLTIGFAISIVPQKVHAINFERNVRAEESNDLKFVRKEDLKLLLKGIALNKKGKRLNYEFGDKNGTQRTLHFTEKTLAELKELTQKTYKSLNFDGYKGKIPTWGLPRTKAGEAVFLTDPNIEKSERNGKYLIESVEINFNGSDGFKRSNELGLKL